MRSLLVYPLYEDRDRYAQRPRKGDKVVEADFAGAALDVRNMDLMHTRMLGKIDLPPSLFPPELSDPFPEPGGWCRLHSSSMEFVYALNLVYTLFHRIFRRRARRIRTQIPRNRKGGPHCQTESCCFAAAEAVAVVAAVPGSNAK